MDKDSKDRTVTFVEEELISAAVLDIPAASTDKLKSGSRVAVFPASVSSHLVPGTVRKVINAYMLQVRTFPINFFYPFPRLGLETINSFCKRAHG